MKANFVTNVLAFIGTILLITSCGQETTRRRVPKWHIKMAQSQGPNACAVEEIPGTNKRFWTECKYWMHRKVCGKKTVIRYECCEGYDRVPGRQGCVAVKPLKNILETAEDLGATIFVQFLRDSGLAERLQRDGAFTLFAPVNSAFETLTASQKDQLQRSRNNPWSTILLNHLAEGRTHTDDLEADHLVITMNRGQQLRISKYSNGMITANCAPLVRKDQEATNGIVHLVDNVLDPISSGHLMDSLIQDGRFVQFSRLLRESQVDGDLRVGGPYTIFAPYDEAFQKYPASRLERIRADPKSLRALVQAHIVPHLLCIPAVIDEHRLKSLSGEKANVMCNETGVYVENSRLSGEFLTGNNGVIQIISDVIVPNRAKSVLELAEDTQEVPTFLQFVLSAGAIRALDGGGNLTVFAPTEAAFEHLPEQEMQRLTKNASAAREMVMYHVVQGRHNSQTFRDDQRVRSVDGHNNLRLRVYRKGYGVESAMIKSADHEGHNGILHVIDRILIPATLNIMETLQKDGNFSIMLEALQKARTVGPGLLETDARAGHSSLTLFAPSDEAFRKLGKEQLQRVMTDTEYLTQVVKNHIVDNMVPSCAFKAKLQYNVKTKNNILEIHKKHHHIEVSGAHVLKQDMVTRDGIVHFVDRVILPDDAPASIRLCTHCQVESNNVRP